MTAAEKSDLADVVRTGELLGVSLHNIQIGAEKGNLKRKYKMKTINNTSKVSLAQRCIVRNILM